MAAVGAVVVAATGGAAITVAVVVAVPVAGAGLADGMLGAARRAHGDVRWPWYGSGLFICWADLGRLFLT